MLTWDKIKMSRLNLLCGTGQPPASHCWVGAFRSFLPMTFTKQTTSTIVLAPSSIVQMPSTVVLTPSTVIPTTSTVILARTVVLITSTIVLATSINSTVYQY